MEGMSSGVFVLFLLPAPVSCLSFSTFTHPVICYFLDAFLLVYCIVATALFFKEKFSDPPADAKPEQESNAGIYQELELLTDPDPYQVLDPSKRKRKAGKKKKPVPTGAQNRDSDPYECLTPTEAPPALPRR